MSRVLDLYCYHWTCWLSLAVVLMTGGRGDAADWPQLLGNGLRSGDAAGFAVDETLGLLGSVPMSDAILASPVVSGDHVYVLDGSGLLACIDIATRRKQWQFMAPCHHSVLKPD